MHAQPEEVCGKWLVPNRLACALSGRAALALDVDIVVRDLVDAAFDGEMVGKDLHSLAHPARLRLLWPHQCLGSILNMEHFRFGEDVFCSLQRV